MIWTKLFSTRTDCHHVYLEVYLASVIIPICCILVPVRDGQAEIHEAIRFEKV
jgi:hypothetical protein